MIDRAAALALPGAADEPAMPWLAIVPALMPADGEDEMTRAERGSGAGLCHRQAVRWDAKNGDVGARVAPGERCRDAPPVGQGDSNIVLALQRLFGGDEDAGAPMDGAGRQRRPPPWTAATLARRLSTSAATRSEYSARGSERVGHGALRCCMTSIWQRAAAAPSAGWAGRAVSPARAMAGAGTSCA